MCLANINVTPNDCTWKINKIIWSLFSRDLETCQKYVESWRIIACSLSQPATTMMSEASWSTTRGQNIWTHWCLESLVTQQLHTTRDRMTNWCALFSLLLWEIKSFLFIYPNILIPLIWIRKTSTKRHFLAQGLYEGSYRTRHRCLASKWCYASNTFISK